MLLRPLLLIVLFHLLGRPLFVNYLFNSWIWSSLVDCFVFRDKFVLFLLSLVLRPSSPGQGRNTAHKLTHKRSSLPTCSLKSSMMVLDLLPRFWNLDCLGSARCLPSLQGHLRWRRGGKETDQKDVQLRRLSSRGEWNERASLISSCQKPRLWQDPFIFAFDSPICRRPPSGILSLIHLCEAKVGLKLEKHTWQIIDLGDKATETPDM